MVSLLIREVPTKRPCVKRGSSPFTKATGIKVVTVSGTDAEKRAKVTAMVQTGNVTWDLYLDGEIQAGSDAHFAITEDLSDFASSSLTARTRWPTRTRGGGEIAVNLHPFGLQI